MEGTWAALGNGHYSIVPDNGQNDTKFETVISGNSMSVLNTSSGDTHKISDIPDVGQVSFNYIP